MGLLAKLSPDDTIREFEFASESRRRDAQPLRSAGRAYWGVYTLGYAAEMLLKAACFRTRGEAPRTSLVSELRLRRLMDRAAEVRATSSRARNLHDLVFWVHLLVAERAHAAHAGAGSPLPVDFANELVAQVQRIAGHWRENMRYRRSIPASAEYAEVRACVSWLVQNYSRMWS